MDSGFASYLVCVFRRLSRTCVSYFLHLYHGENKATLKNGFKQQKIYSIVDHIYEDQKGQLKCLQS